MTPRVFLLGCAPLGDVNGPGEHGWVQDHHLNRAIGDANPKRWGDVIFPLDRMLGVGKDMQVIVVGESPDLAGLVATGTEAASNQMGPGVTAVPGIIKADGLF